MGSDEDGIGAAQISNWAAATGYDSRANTERHMRANESVPTRATVSDEDREKVQDILCRPMCKFWGADMVLDTMVDCCRAAKDICPEFKAGCQAFADQRQRIEMTNPNIQQIVADEGVISYRVGFMAGGEAVKRLVLAMEKCARYQDRLDGMIVQLEGFIEARDVRQIKVGPPIATPPAPEQREKP